MLDIQATNARLNHTIDRMEKCVRQQQAFMKAAAQLIKAIRLQYEQCQLKYWFIELSAEDYQTTIASLEEILLLVYRLLFHHQDYEDRQALLAKTRIKNHPLRYFIRKLLAIHHQSDAVVRPTTSLIKKEPL